MKKNSICIYLCVKGHYLKPGWTELVYSWFICTFLKNNQHVTCFVPFHVPDLTMNIKALFIELQSCVTPKVSSTNTEWMWNNVWHPHTQGEREKEKGRERERASERERPITMIFLVPQFLKLVLTATAGAWPMSYLAGLSALVSRPTKHTNSSAISLSGDPSSVSVPGISNCREPLQGEGSAGKLKRKNKKGWAVSCTECEQASNESVKVLASSSELAKYAMQHRSEEETNKERWVDKSNQWFVFMLNLFKKIWGWPLPHNGRCSKKRKERVQ